MPLLSPVPRAQFRRQKWANGQGTTTELAVDAAHQPWHWRISMAEVAADGDFSVLPGVRRWLVPLNGRLRLTSKDTQKTVTISPLQTHAFDGGEPIYCQLLDGPGRDLNLMLRGDLDGDLTVRSMAGDYTLPQREGRWFLFQLTGGTQVQAAAESIDLQAHNALWVQPQGQTVHVHGTGELALFFIGM